MRVVLLCFLLLSCSYFLGDCLGISKSENTNVAPLIASKSLADPGFLGLGIVKIKIKFIICFFIANCSWPRYSSALIPFVQSSSKDIFTKNDSYIRSYCEGIFIIAQICRPPAFTTTLGPTTSTSTTTTTTTTTEASAITTTAATVEPTTTPSITSTPAVY